jgi:hypothetical protein
VPYSFRSWTIAPYIGEQRAFDNPVWGDPRGAVRRRPNHRPTSLNEMSEQEAPPRVESRSLRPLRMAETGQPAPFRLGAPAYLVAFAGWLAAALLLLDSAPELTRLSINGRAPWVPRTRSASSSSPSPWQQPCGSCSR